jgi:hypothetical protein
MEMFDWVVVNRPVVASDVIDGEVVMICFDTGNYYSLGGAGALVWELLQQPTSLAQVATALTGSYDGDAWAIARSVEGLVAELVAEGLVVPAPDSHAQGAPSEATAEAASEPRPPFEPPTLQRYTDMQDLLLLDPIHDVDESGWPERR